MTRLLTWDDGRPIYLILASASVALFFATKETAFITLGTMLIACASVWVWRGIRDSLAFKKNWFNIVLAVHGVLIVIALYNRSSIADGVKFLSDYFFPAAPKPAENFAFFGIIFLVIAAIVAWMMFLSDLRRANETEVEEPVDLTLANLGQGAANKPTAFSSLQRWGWRLFM